MRIAARWRVRSSSQACAGLLSRLFDIATVLEPRRALALALASPLAARGVVLRRRALVGEDLGRVAVDHLGRGRRRRRRRLARARPRDRLAGVPGGRPAPRHPVEDREAEPAEPDHQRQQRERRDDEQRRDAERHPEGGEEAGQQPDPLRLQRERRPSPRSSPRSAGKSRFEADRRSAVLRRSGRRAACRCRRPAPTGRRSPRRPASGANQATIPCTASSIGPMKTKPTIAPLTRSLRAWAAPEEVEQRDHAARRRRGAQDGRAQRAARRRRRSPGAARCRGPSSGHRAALVRARPRRCRAGPRRSRETPREALTAALALDDLATVHARSVRLRPARRRALELDAVRGGRIGM